MENFTHKLISNLTTNEKVNFKRYSRIHSTNQNKNYIKVYEKLVSMTSYERNDLLELFKGTSIKRYLNSELRYLQERVLLSLVSYDMKRSKRNQIQKDILIIDALASRGYQKEASKKIKAVKKRALAQEEFTFLLHLIELEESVLFKEGSLGYKEKLDVLILKRKEINEKIQNLNEYHRLRQTTRELQFSKNLLEKKGLLKSLNENKLINDKKKCLSTRAKEHWFYIRVLISYMNYDFIKGLQISSDYINFMMKHQHLFLQSKILPALSNYIFHAALTAKENHFHRGVKLIQQLSKSGNFSSHYISYILDSRCLEFAYYSQNQQMANKCLKSIIKLLKKNINKYEEPQIQYIYMLVVRTYIDLEDYQKAMKMCNLWLRRGVLEYRKVQARLFSLLINYSLGHFELIRSEIRLLKPLVKINIRDKELVDIFYKFFQLTIKSSADKNAQIEILQKSLNMINRKNPGYFIFVGFNYFEWSKKLD